MIVDIFIFILKIFNNQTKKVNKNGKLRFVEILKHMKRSNNDFEPPPAFKT